jgi:hypothetical protein
VQKANTSNKEKNRFIEFAEGYDDSAKLFVIEQAKQHHDAAFASAYRMWILSPIAELDLASAYDERAYYRTIAKKIKQASKRSNEDGAHLIVQDIAKYYHVKVENTEKNSERSSQSSKFQDATSKRISLEKWQARRQKNDTEQPQTI